MKYGRSAAFGLILALITSTASAADMWSALGKVTAVMPYDDGSIHVWADMSRADPAGCGGDRYIVPAANSNVKETYAALLTAFTSGKQVRFYVWGATCAAGNPTVRLAEVRD
jgi:hypothetical protein